MPPNAPLVRLPPLLTFTLEEVADILYAVDVAVDRSAPTSPDHRAARRVQRLITARLWPDLGILLGDDERNGE